MEFLVKQTAKILTTAADGTWILATDLGRTWLAKWL